MSIKFLIRVRTADLGWAGRDDALRFKIGCTTFMGQDTSFTARGTLSGELTRPGKDFERANTSEFSLVFSNVDRNLIQSIDSISLKGSDGDAMAFEWLDVRVEKSDLQASFHGRKVTKRNRGKTAEQRWIKGRWVKFYPVEMYEYTLRTKTSSADNADTGSRLSVSFPNALDENAAKELHTFLLETAANDFGTGATDIFTIKTIFPLSTKVEGTAGVSAPLVMDLIMDGDDAWKVEWMQLEQIDTGHIWSFLPKGTYDEIDNSATITYHSTDATFYDIIVKTGVIENAGTDAEVNITLYDAGGAKHTYILDEPARDDFNRYGQDSFRVMSHEIKDLKKVTVRLGDDDDWFLDWVEVKQHNHDETKSWTFPHVKWIRENQGEVTLRENPMQYMRIITKTGSAEHAGTDSDIKLQLYGVRNGKNVHSTGFILDTPEDDMERLNADTFYIRSDQVMDEVTHIALDNTGDDWWQVEWVQVDLLSDDSEVQATFNFPGRKKDEDPMGVGVGEDDTFKWAFWSFSGVLLHAARMTSYVFGVQTGALSNTGGNKVVAELTDDQGHRVSIKLDHSHKDRLKPGDVARYYHKTMEDFGNLVSVKLRGMNSKWFMDWASVNIDNNISNNTYPFYHYDWINTQKTLRVRNNHVTLDKDQLLEMASRNCPVLVHHREEKYPATSVESFLKRDSVSLYDKRGRLLNYHEESDFSEVPKHGKDCFFKDSESSEDMTRAFKKNEAKVYVNIKGLKNSAFVDIQYWYFYPWNGAGRIRMTSIIADTNTMDKEFVLGNLGVHEGDWEHVTIRVNTKNKKGKEAKAMFLSQHDGGRWLPMSELKTDKRSGRPKFYASLNGHAAYAKPEENGSSYTRHPPRLGGFFHFLSPPALAVEILNKCNEGKAFDGAGNMVMIGVNDIEKIKDFDPPTWMKFRGRWGHAAAPTKEDEPEVPEETIRNAFAQVFATAAPYFVVLGALSAFFPPLLVILVAGLYAEYYLLVNPEQLSKPLLKKFLPGGVADGNGPTGPAEKGNWRGAE